MEFDDNGSAGSGRPPALPADRRSELLARADAEALWSLAERCVENTRSVIVTSPAQVGTMLLQVREPIAHERFYLAEIVVTQAEVEVEGTPGWSMRLGDDGSATIAAAICDAEVERGGPLATTVERLCGHTADRLQAEREREAAALAPTQVQFEDLP